MYLRLGSTNINYQTTPIDDFMVFSGIVNSEIGPGSPKIVRSVQELECYFGKDFDDYSYYVELLSYPSVALYLASETIQNQYTEDVPVEGGETYGEVHKIYKALDVSKDGAEDIGFRFLSKSVGEVEKGIYAQDSIIQVQIEYIDQKKGIYRVTIQRFDYEEIFEGSVFDIPGEERLDYVISKKSNLLVCEIKDPESLPIEDIISVSFDENIFYLDIDEDGTEEITSETSDSSLETDYLNLLKTMFSEDWDNVCIDYLLLHELGQNSKEPEALKPIQLSLGDLDLQDLLERARTYKFQVLLERDDKDEVAIDNENWIVYFWKSGNLTYRGWKRPGYYTFLRGLLDGSYSWSGTDIIYYSPQSDAYEDTELSRTLKSKKINYMVFNNYKYYFKEYFNGEDYVSTIWMRFVIGKVWRELMKHKWSYLGKKTGDPKILDNINSTLSRIKNTFKIVGTIEVEEYSMDAINNKLDLTIHTEVNDLADNDMELDITINY